MDIETLFVDAKWRMLSALAHEKQSPSELAAKTGTTVANISTQIRLLEALDFVKQEPLSNVAKGQPRKLYDLNKEFCYLVMASKFATGKKMLKLEKELMPFFTSWLIPDKKISILLIKFYLEHEAILKQATSFGFLALKPNELEIIIVHPQPEKAYPLNDKSIKRGDKKYKIHAHVHTKESFEQGFHHNDDYHKSVLRKVILLSDDHFLANLKRGVK